MLRATLIATSVLILASADSGGAQAPCVGDCDGNRAVGVAEIVSGVEIALGREAVAACAAMDADNSQGVTVSELTSAVDFALNGCPRCGDPVLMARFEDCRRSRNQTACESAGGTWGPYPFSGDLGCFCATGQEGCVCRRADDCLSLCRADIPTDFPSCASVQMGTCVAMTPPAGCFCTPGFSGGSGFMSLCIDP